VWVELIKWISFYESSWSPLTRYNESTMGTDPITGLPVYSEGLLQLSYQDSQWAPYCKFDWAKDKDLHVDDPKKTILNPFNNLDCGMRILANQIQKRGKIVLQTGHYWSVLRESGRYSKVSSIVDKVSSFCAK